MAESSQETLDCTDSYSSDEKVVGNAMQLLKLESDSQEEHGLGDLNKSSFENLESQMKARIRSTMLERLSFTSAHFAHQQRGAPDLTQQEKIDIAAEILDRNPSIFLAR